MPAKDAEDRHGGNQLDSGSKVYRRERSRFRWKSIEYAWDRGLEVETLPARYLEYFFFAVCGLGVADVNIWHRGPLDPRMDPPLEETETLDDLPDEFGSST